MSAMTDWEKRLRQRAAAIKRAETALKKDLAAARLDGKHFRELGKWAGINHETARKFCVEINGHTRTREELAGDEGPPAPTEAAEPEPTTPTPAEG